MKAAAAAAAVLALGAAPPVQASSESEAAHAFARAALQLRLSVSAASPSVRAGLAQLRDPRCRSAVRHEPAGRESGSEEFFGAVFRIVFRGGRPALDAFVARLDAVPTSDRRLRSGRASWRAVVTAVDRLGPPPADLCATLDAWRKAGYPADGAPPGDEEILTAFLKSFRNVDLRTTSAARRMRALGVTARAARRFTGDELFAGAIDQAVDDVFAGLDR